MTELSTPTKKYQSNHIAERLGIRHDNFCARVLQEFTLLDKVNIPQSQNGAGRPQQILLLEQKHLFRLPIIFPRHEVALELYDELMNELFKPPQQEIVLPNFLETARLLVAALEKQEQQALYISELEPKAAIHDIFLTAENTKDIGTVAKELGYGRNTFFAMLRRDSILMENNIPYEPHMKAKRFVVIEVPKEINGKIQNISQTRVTAKGELYLAKFYGLK